MLNPAQHIVWKSSLSSLQHTVHTTSRFRCLSTMPQLFSFSFHTSFIPSWRNISVAVKQTPRAQGTVLLCSRPTRYLSEHKPFQLVFTVVFSQPILSHPSKTIITWAPFLLTIFLNWIFSSATILKSTPHPPLQFLNCKIPSTYSHHNLIFPISLLLSDGNQNRLTENRQTYHQEADND